MHIGVLRRTDEGEGHWGGWLMPLTGSRTGPQGQRPGKGRGQAGWPGPHQECGAGGDSAAQVPRQAFARVQLLFSNWVEQQRFLLLSSSLNPLRPSHGVCVSEVYESALRPGGSPVPSPFPTSPVSFLAFPTPHSSEDHLIMCTRARAHTHTLYLRADTPGTPPLLM